jgi:hypothetical protein
MLADVQHLLAETLRPQCMAGVRISSVYALWVIRTSVMTFQTLGLPRSTESLSGRLIPAEPALQHLCPVDLGVSDLRSAVLEHRHEP